MGGERRGELPVSDGDLIRIGGAVNEHELNSSQGERTTVIKAGHWEEDVLRSVSEKAPATKDGKPDSK